MRELNSLDDEKPCAHCGSPRHGSLGHRRLVTMQERWQNWGIGWEHIHGMPGGRSPGDLTLAPPDLVQIVPSISGVAGPEEWKEWAPAILRLWSPDPSGGLTFMLSYDSPAISEMDRRSLEKLFGDLGSRGTVAVRFASMTPNEGRGIT